MPYRKFYSSIHAGSATDTRETLRKALLVLIRGMLKETTIKVAS